MLYNLCYLFLIFIIYSFLGWLVEVIGKYFTLKKFVNRGFLIGPYCPIYGVGALLITYVLGNYADDAVVLFILSMTICMALEYLTSYVMEKIFRARWWDYSDKIFNINGRVCLETSILFGLGGLSVIYLINPIIAKIFNYVPNNLIIILVVILFVLFITDVIISCSVVSKIKSIDISKYTGIFRRDDTERINKRVREYFMQSSYLTRRLMESFPNFRIRIDKIRDSIKKKKEMLKRRKKK